MKKWLVILSLLLQTGWGMAQEPDASQQAETFYREGKYQEAAGIYNQILTQGLESAKLYYNLGNCYYKLGENTKAILNYERSLLLNPGDADARYNLKMAQNQVVDKIEVLPELFLVRWYKAFCFLFFRRPMGLYLCGSFPCVSGDGSLVSLFFPYRLEENRFCRWNRSFAADRYDGYVYGKTE